MTQEDVGLADRRAVAALADLYRNGARRGRCAIMRPAFHSGAAVRGTLDDKPIDVSIEDFFTFVDAKPAPTVEVRIASIDLHGDAGTMRLECLDWHGVRYTDFFTVLRFDGVWIITSKVFHGKSAGRSDVVPPTI